MSLLSSLGSQIYKAATLAFRKSIYHNWNYPAETTTVCLFIPKSQYITYMIFWNTLKRVIFILKQKMTLHKKVSAFYDFYEYWILDTGMRLQEWQGFQISEIVDVLPQQSLFSRELMLCYGFLFWQQVGTNTSLYYWVVAASSRFSVLPFIAEKC